MQKTKVMFVVFQLVAAGSERVVLELARGLNSDQFEIYVASFNSGVLEAALREVCQDIFFINKKKGLDIWAMLQIAKIIRRYEIDIVNAHHYMPLFYSFLGTKFFNRKRLVYTEHSVPEVENIVSRIHGKILYWMLFRINAVIGVSQEIAETFKRYYPGHIKKFHTILNGVDIEKFRDRGLRKNIRSRWGFSEDHFVVGMIANFRKVKNHACLVRAVARLKASYPQLRLFFVGSGWRDDFENSEKEVQDLIHDLNLEECVVFAGYQQNIPEILSVLDAFCLPSFSEGLPVSILEAMAAGVPVVGSKVRGITEVINHRETGLLFMPDDDQDLARLLNELITTPKLLIFLANSAFSYINKNHSRDIWLNNTFKILMNSVN